MKKYRIVNPGRRKARVGRKTTKVARTGNPTRKLSLAQKLHFGTARQRASAKRILGGKHKRRTSNPRKRLSAGAKVSKSGNRKIRKASAKKNYVKAMYYDRKHHSRWNTRAKSIFGGRSSNPAEIITLTNPGSYAAGTKRKSSSKRKPNLMARRKHTARKTTHRRRTVRRSNPGFAVTRRRTRRSNPGISRTRRRRNGYSSRRRNPGQLTGGFNAAFGVIGGAVITNMVTSRLPAGWNTGFMGYAATAVVAVAQGSLAGKVFKNAQLGKNMTIGGLAVLVMKLLGDFMPGFSSPFGMGVIAPSSFYLPQVNQNNSMTSFVTPAAVAGVINTNAASGMAGIGRRGGRMR